MKFLIDAQLPRRVAVLLNNAGHDAVHTLDLPRRNLTTDAEILLIAEREGRVVVSKDSDFVNSFILNGKPEKLLLISTGNISNAQLHALLLANLASLVEALTSNALVELTRATLVIHS